MRHLLLILVCFTLFFVASAQEQAAIDSVTKARRVRLVASIFGGSYGASFISLNKAWYANYPRSRFEIFILAITLRA
jgi:hypothetical protein